MKIYDDNNTSILDQIQDKNNINKHSISNLKDNKFNNPNMEFKTEIIPEDNKRYDLTFKIIVIGDSNVGKSCLTMRATRNYYEEFYSPTLGFEFFTLTIKINDCYVKLQIWDTSGQETYNSLISSFYRCSSLAILAYSVDDKKSFDHLNFWLNEIKTQSNPDVIIFLIGNKVDLINNKVISTEIAQNFVDNNNIFQFFETSAKTGYNAKNVFIEAAKELYHKHLKSKDNMTRQISMNSLSVDSITIKKDLKTKEEEKKKSCC